MTNRDLRDMIRMQPFKPLKLHLADGRSFRVTHPEFIASSPTGRTAIVFDEDDTFEVIDVMLITGIETLSA